MRRRDVPTSIPDIQQILTECASEIRSVPAPDVSLAVRARIARMAAQVQPSGSAFSGDLDDERVSSDGGAILVHDYPTFRRRRIATLKFMAACAAVVLVAGALAFVFQVLPAQPGGLDDTQGDSESGFATVDAAISGSPTPVNTQEEVLPYWTWVARDGSAPPGVDHKAEVLPYPVPASCPVTAWSSLERRRLDFPAWWLDGSGLAVGNPIGPILFGSEDGQKMQWQAETENFEEPVVTGERLDAPSAERPEAQNVTEIGLAIWSSVVVFPEPGCWSLHATAGSHSLDAVVYVYPDACRLERQGASHPPSPEACHPSAAPGATVTKSPGTPTPVSIAESPLATWDPSSVDAFLQAGQGPGILDISDGCVLLTGDNGSKVLLVWPEPTAWDASTQTIEFVSPMGSADLELHNGDRLSAGGSTMTGSFSLFVSSPTSSCKTQADSTFIVSEIQVLTQ